MSNGLRSALVMAFAALVLTGCGSVATGAAPSPTPSVSPGFGFDVVVTEKDRTATLHVGQKLELVLHSGNGMSNWNSVRSSDASVLAPIPNPAATAIRGVTLAAFKAVAPGQATITAVGGPICSPGQMCPMYAVLYSTEVTVTL